MMMSHAWLVLAVVLLFAETPCSGGNTCCVPEMWVSRYTGYTNSPGRAKAFEANFTYSASHGSLSQALLGPRLSYTVYNLPRDVFVVNNSHTPHTCMHFSCTHRACFTPICAGGPEWNFNSTVLLGLQKVEKWTTGPAVVLLQASTSTRIHCVPISYTAVVGTQEYNVQFYFGMWYNVVQQTVPSNIFDPPSFCRHKLTRSMTYESLMKLDDPLLKQLLYRDFLFAK